MCNRKKMTERNVNPGLPEPNLIQDAIADDLRATILSVASLVRALFSAMFFSIFGHVLGLYPIQIALGIIGTIAIAITAVVSLKMVGMQVSKN